MKNLLEEQMRKTIENSDLNKLYGLNQNSLSIKINSRFIYLIFKVEKHFYDKIDVIKKYLFQVLLKNHSERIIKIIFTNDTSNSLSENGPINQTVNQKNKLYKLAKKTILISSCKGGVGKSTMSALIGQKLSKKFGKSVAILDADIYGPSIPSIFNMKETPKIDINTKKMIPPYSKGVYLNSIGFLIEDSSVALRAPIVNKALHQLLLGSLWKENLDYMIIDTPPGTGDIHLSLLQNYEIDFAILITTPQKISEINVSRTIDLYRKFNLEIRGVIENMSYFLDNTKKEVKIFSGNSADQISSKYNIPIIDKVPLTLGLSETCDLGDNLDKFFNLISFNCQNKIL